MGVISNDCGVAAFQIAPDLFAVVPLCLAVPLAISVRLPVRRDVCLHKGATGALGVLRIVIRLADVHLEILKLPLFVTNGREKVFNHNDGVLEE